MRETENMARALAQRLFKSPDCAGVRVIKNWERSDGTITETVIFNESREPTEKPVAISTIETAPICHATEDYYRWASRNTINRLFSKYFDRANLTASELLHSHSALKKVQEVDTLFPSAVDRVATLQGRATGEDPRKRRDELYQTVARISDRVRRAEQRGLPSVEKGLGPMYDAVKALVPEDELQFHAQVSLCRELVKDRSWLAKLDHMAKLIGGERRREVLALIDEVVADLVGIGTALQDILGQQRNLAKALCALADLHDGVFDSGKSDAHDQLSALSPLLAEGLLTETRTSVLDRLQRQLAGSQPLSKNDPSQEQDAFRDVVARLFRDKVILGGPSTAAALTRRFVFYQEAGGKAGLRASVGGVVTTLDDPLMAVIYLIALAGSDLAEELNEVILFALKHVVEEADMQALTPRLTAPKDRLIRAKQIFDRIHAATVIPEAERRHVLDRIDDIFADYIRREGIIERLDDPRASLRDRAVRLVEFCGAGLLPDGKALHTARERVIGLLRQPNFTQRFLEGLGEPSAAERELRDFHLRLARGGFK